MHASIKIYILNYFIRSAGMQVIPKPCHTQSNHIYTCNSFWALHLWTQTYPKGILVNLYNYGNWEIISLAKEYEFVYYACSKKDQTFAIKTLLLIYSILSTVPFKVVPSTGNTPFPMFFDCWNASWNALSVMVRSSLIAFSWISSMVWKRHPFKVVLSLENRKKSAGAKSRE